MQFSGNTKNRVLKSCDFFHGVQNIMFKSVKCIFLVIPKFLGFKKSAAFFTGFRIHFFFQIGTLEIVKNHLSQKGK